MADNVWGIVRGTGKKAAACLTVTLVLTAMILAAGSYTWASGSAAERSIQVIIDGESVSFTEESGQPFIDDAQRVQVPLRLPLAAFGGQVEWDEVSQTVIVEKGEDVIWIPVGENHIVKNGDVIENDTAAVILDGRTYLPVRKVFEAFDAHVGWWGGDQSSQSSAVSGPAIVVSSADVVTVHFLDIGQGDSALIDYGDFEILIDGGLKSESRYLADYIRPYVQGELDIVIATHEHWDHVGGLITVLEEYDVGTVISNGRSGETKTWQEFNEALLREGCEHIVASELALNIGSIASLSIFKPQGEFSTESSNSYGNNHSLVSILAYNDVKMLFTGDIEKEAELANLSRFPEVQVLQAAHHGSYTSSSAEFLEQTRPEVVIISAGKDNESGHPHQSSLKRLEDTGAEIYITFETGTVVIRTNGEEYQVIN